MEHVQLSQETVNGVINTLSQLPYTQSGALINRIMLETGNAVPGIGSLKKEESNEKTEE